MSKIRDILEEVKKGRGRNNGDKPGSGPGGECVCPNCGYIEKHKVNEPCNKRKCPKCGTVMTKKIDDSEEDEE